MRAGSAPVGTVPASADVLGASVESASSATEAGGAVGSTASARAADVSGADPTAFDGSSLNNALTPETNARSKPSNTTRTTVRRIMNVRRVGRGRLGGWGRARGGAADSVTGEPSR